MPGPFTFNNRFLGKNKQNWEDSYFDYMNTSNAVGNYPTYSKKEYARDIRNRNKKEAYNNNIFGDSLSPVQYQTPFNAGNLSPIRTTAPAYNFDIEEWENNQQNNFRDSVQDMARDMSDNFEQEEFDPTEAEAMNSWNVQKDEDGNILGAVAANRDNGQFGGTAWDWKFKVKDENGNVIGEKDRSGLGKGLGMGLAVAGQVGDSLLNNSYKGNQGAYVSGAFGKNQLYDDIANTRTTIAATDFNDAYQQQRGITNQLNAQKTKELSGGQIAGMAGVGAAKGASAGAAFGPYGCVCAGTRVIKNNGEFVNIEDLKQEDGIIGFGDNTIQKQTIFAFKPVAIKDCLRITFDNSDILECSIDHPIYSTSKGRSNREYINGIRTRIKQFNFKPACELSIGDKVAAPDKIDIWGDKELQNARLIGLLIGDGSYDVNHGVRMYSQDKEIWDYIESNNLGYKLNDKYDYTVEFRAYKINNGPNILRELGIHGQTGENKTLINDIHLYNKQSMCDFVGGLFDTDGCIYYSEKNPKESEISFSQSKYKLIKQLKELLLKLGIHSYIKVQKPKKNYYNGKEINSGENYVLNIRDTQSIINFYENISLIVKKKQDKLKLVYDFKKTIIERNPRHNGVKSIKIKNIEYIGKKEIYNLQADDYHTYIANGIITHNTLIGGAIGGIAGGAKGLLANNQIKDSNLMVGQKQQEANNYMQNAMSSIRNRNALRNKQSAYNMYAYNNAYGGNLYANGGALQDPYGINYFGNGKSHEKNKFGGVPVSIAPDGKPNLVEEGEVLYDDYVYSKRIKLPDSMRRQLNLKDDVKTFADAAKAIQERGKERPNDPVMEHTIKAQMQKLKSKQEEVKEKKEQREQEKILAQMSEQERQMIEQQQMEQQADAYEQQLAAEQQAQMAQQQIPQEGIPQEQMAMQEQQPAMLYAKGGKLKGGTNDIDSHKFADEDEEPQGYDWDSFEINGNRYNFVNKGDRSKGMWDYGYNDDGSDDEFYNYYSKIFKEGDDGYFTDNYTDYYKNAVEWARNLPTEDKEKFLEKYEPYYEQEFNGRQLEGTTEEKFDKFLNWANDNKWGNNHMILSDMYDHFNPQEESIEEAHPQGKQKGNANWMEYVPLGIDAYLAARSFAPVDYSRANAIMNTPIRDIQYNPNGQYIKPYIIDPRQQYMMNYTNAQATNRAIQNNAGGNGANAVAAMLANNAATNQAAAQLGFQADAQNAAQLQAAIQANNDVDARNAEGFLQAAAENQRADQIRGNFRATGLQMKDALDAARGQAISNSMGAIAYDINNLNQYQYDKNWNKALAGAGYYGNLTPEGMRLVGIDYQNTPQAELDRQNAIQIAQMQSEDARLAREQQERINESQLAAMAQQAAMNYPYYE